MLKAINNLDGSTLRDNLIRANKRKFQLKLLKMTKRAWCREYLPAIRYVVSGHKFSNSLFLRNHISIFMLDYNILLNSKVGVIKSLGLYVRVYKISLKNFYLIALGGFRLVNH